MSICVQSSCTCIWLCWLFNIKHHVFHQNANAPWSCFEQELYDTVAYNHIFIHLLPRMPFLMVNSKFILGIHVVFLLDRHTEVILGCYSGNAWNRS